MMDSNNSLAVKNELVQCRHIDMNNLLDRFTVFLDVSHSSVHTYSFGVRRFIQFLNEYSINMPTRETVLMYKKALAERNCKPSTVALYLSALRRFFAWLESEGLYPNITAGVKSPKQDTGHKKDALSSTQLKSIMQGINRETLEGKRNYAIFALIAACGLRTVEVIRANVGDIREVYGEYCLYVQGKGRNTKSEFVKLAQPVIEAIREYLAERGNVEDDMPLFASCSKRNKGQRLTTRTISGVCKDAMKSAGYNSTRLTAHSLRHSAVTIALMTGASLQEVQAFARHSNLNTTMIYSHEVNRLKSQVENKIAGAIFAA